MTYTCPNCNHTIAMDDVNVAKDIALCRSCGETCAFSELIDDDVATQPVDTSKLPRGIQYKQTISEMGIPMTEIIYNRIGWVQAIFMTAFTSVWGGVSMKQLYIEPLILKGQAWSMTQVMGLPFLIGTCVLTYSVLFHLFGKRTITLSQGKAVLFAGIGPLGFRRRFDYNRNTRVSTRAPMPSGRGSTMPKVIFTTNSKQTEVSYGDYAAVQTIATLAQNAISQS